MRRNRSIWERMDEFVHRHERAVPKWLGQWVCDRWDALVMGDPDAPLGQAYRRGPDGKFKAVS